jgi:hypothetical protein
MKKALILLYWLKTLNEIIIEIMVLAVILICFLSVIANICARSIGYTRIANVIRNYWDYIVIIWDHGFKY